MCIYIFIYIYIQEEKAIQETMTARLLNDDSRAARGMLERIELRSRHGSIPWACTTIPLTNDAIKGALTYNFPREIIGDSAELARTVFIIHIQEQQSTLAVHCRSKHPGLCGKVREKRDFNWCDVLVHSCESILRGQNMRIYVCGIACGGKIKRRFSFSYTLSS